MIFRNKPLIRIVKYEYEKLSIKSWAEEDRPREKLLLKGKSALSDAELVAILIGSGTPKESAVDVAKKILQYVNNNLNELGKLSVKDLMKVKGIGEAKAISIIAALELGRRRQGTDAEKRKKIQGSEGVFRIFQPLLADLPHEEFWVLFLNKANMVIGKERVSTGGVDGAIADAKIIFKTALEKLASSIILCHNHPSGNLSPSKADIALTTKIKQAGENLDIKVLDHIIVSDKGYYSFNDEGEM